MRFNRHLRWMMPGMAALTRWLSTRRDEDFKAWMAADMQMKAANLLHERLEASPSSNVAGQAFEQSRVVLLLDRLLA